MRESYLFVFSRCGIYLRYRQPVRVWERVPLQLRLLRVQPAPIIAKIFPVFHRPLWHLVKPPCKVLLVSKMNFPVTTPMLLLTTGKFWFWKLGFFCQYKGTLPRSLLIWLIHGPNLNNTKYIASYKLTFAKLSHSILTHMQNLFYLSVTWSPEFYFLNIYVHV